jgi:hypothetical protein
LSQTPPFDFGDKIRCEQPMTDDRFIQIDAMPGTVTPWSGICTNGYVTDF